MDPGTKVIIRQNPHHHGAEDIAPFPSRPLPFLSFQFLMNFLDFSLASDITRVICYIVCDLRCAPTAERGRDNDYR